MKFLEVEEIELPQNSIYDPMQYPHSGFYLVKGQTETIFCKDVNGYVTSLAIGQMCKGV